MGLVHTDEPKFLCCGSSYGSAGLMERQRESRKGNIRAWQEVEVTSVSRFLRYLFEGVERIYS